jgi:hypothetical protein
MDKRATYGWKIMIGLGSELTRYQALSAVPVLYILSSCRGYRTYHLASQSFGLDETIIVLEGERAD